MQQFNQSSIHANIFHQFHVNNVIHSVYGHCRYLGTGLAVCLDTGHAKLCRWGGQRRRWRSMMVDDR